MRPVWTEGITHAHLAAVCLVCFEIQQGGPWGWRGKRGERGGVGIKEEMGEHSVGALQTIGGNLTLILSEMGSCWRFLSRGRMWSYIGLERMLLKFHQGWKQGDRRGGCAFIQMRDHGDWVSSGKQSRERRTNSEDALGVEPRNILMDQIWSWEKRRTRRLAWSPGKLALPSAETGRELFREQGLEGNH